MAMINEVDLRNGIISELRPGVRNQVTTACELMERLYYGRGKNARGKTRYRKGSDLNEMLSYGNKRSKETDGREDVVVPHSFSAEKQMVVNYGWRVGDILLHDDDLSSNKTGIQIFNLMATRIKNMTEGMAEDVALALYAGKRLKGANGGSAKAFDGIKEVIGNDNIYGGIDRVAFPWFQSKVVDYVKLAASPADSLISLLKIDAMHGQIKLGRKTMPTLQITSQELWQEIVTSARKERSVIEKDPSLSIERGVDNIVLNGSPVIADINCPMYPSTVAGDPAGTMRGDWYYINEDTIQLFVDPDYDFKVSEWKDVYGTKIGGADNGKTGISVHSRALYVKLAMCLYCNEPRSNGKYVGFTLPTE